ncbi:metalloregulator ArsR/SmtB family transcription factor [Kaarinaea lacus]
MIEPNVFFPALSNDIRMRCVMLLVAEEELCVCEITHALRLAQPAVSRHLALLREAGIVLDRREGLWIHYRLHPDLPQWASDVLKSTAKGVSGQSPFADDHKVLVNMPNRPGAPRCA